MATWDDQIIADATPLSELQYDTNQVSVFCRWDDRTPILHGSRRLAKPTIMSDRD